MPNSHKDVSVERSMRILNLCRLLSGLYPFHKYFFLSKYIMNGMISRVLPV